MEIFTQSVYILCRNRGKFVQLLLKIHFLLFKECVAAPRCISMFFKEQAAASERYQ